MARKLNRIQPGTGIYTCQGCQKRTRETNPDAAAVGMCDFCYEQAGWENWVSDNSEFWRNVPEQYRPENWRELDAAKDAKFAELEALQRNVKPEDTLAAKLAEINALSVAAYTEYAARKLEAIDLRRAPATIENLLLMERKEAAADHQLGAFWAYKKALEILQA